MEFSGVLGMALVAIAVSLFWLTRLNSNVSEPIAGHEDDCTSEADVNPEPSPAVVNVILAPEAQSIEESSAAEAIHVSYESDAKADKTLEAGTPKLQIKPDKPDSEFVREQLKIAEQLSVIGDFEGVLQYADLAMSDESASDRQRLQAENLIRLAKMR